MAMESLTFGIQNKKKPLVSVCITTYNHASYIRECLDSILNQQTDFPFEVLIGEDDSSDGTREICKEYAEKHQDKIRLFLRDRKDNIQIGGRPSGRSNFYRTLIAAQSKYVALCDGDDYWTDNQKLAKQVHVLESNQKLSLCYHKISIASERTNYGSTEVLKRKNSVPANNSLGLDFFLKHKNIQLLSVMFRRSFLSNGEIKFLILDKELPFSGDYPLFIGLLSKGDGYFLDIDMGCYRPNEGGMSNRNGFKRDTFELSLLKSLALNSSSRIKKVRNKYLKRKLKSYARRKDFASMRKLVKDFIYYHFVRL